MRTFARSAVTISVAGALLAGCGGSQPPIGAPAEMAKSHALAQARVIVHRNRSAQSSYQVVYSFGGSPDGATPFASLIDVKGVLYGTTAQGGVHSCRSGGCGTVFSVSIFGTEQVKYRFRRPRGKFPVRNLTDVSGTLYGTTLDGGTGAGAGGTVFSISTSGKEQVLHSFRGSSDGLTPRASLIDVSGTLYGTTELGGTYNCGTFFSITPSGAEHVLYSFGGSSSDSKSPQASLIDVNGTLYGTAGGGVYGKGTVFAITTSGKEDVLYSFGGSSSDGSSPAASLIDVSGTLYGTTELGGTYSWGTVFSITTSGTEKVLHSFGSGYDGQFVPANLVDVRGTLYGTTEFGGTYGDGTVFSVSTSGTEQVVHSFNFHGSFDGRYPGAGLIDVNGTLYGTTGDGGANDYGTVFALTP